MRHFCWLMMVVGCGLLVTGINGGAWALADGPQKGADQAAAADSTAAAAGSEKSEKGASDSQAAEKPGDAASDSQDTDKPAEAEQEGPELHTVERAPLRIEVTLDGLFEAQRSEEIVLNPQQWATFTVLKAVPHGAQVERGQVLVTFDPEKIDQAIADLRHELETGRLEIELAEQQLATLEKATPMDLEAAERAQRIAREDLEYYTRIGRPLALKSEEFSLKSARYYLENQEEELRQLEKMYEADDLTEETEEIVLKRARFAVERARFSLEQAKESYDRTMRYLIPRRDVSIEEQAGRAELAREAAQVALPVNLRKQRVALEQLKDTQRRSQEKLENLLADRELMTVRAPLDGVVYYGECQRGKFSDSDTVGANLRPGGNVAARNVILTVVRMRPMFVRVTVPESKLHLVRPGIRGMVEPTGDPGLKLRARVETVGSIPFKSGNFDARVRVRLGEEAAALMPGMACRVKLVAYENKRALVVPTTAVATDLRNPPRQYVYVLGEREKPKRRLVAVGRRSGDRVEILDGLVEGDRILQQHPEEAP